MEGAMGGEGLEQVPREGTSGEVEAGGQILVFSLRGKGGRGQEDGKVDSALGEGGAYNKGEEGELGEAKVVGGGGRFLGGGGGGGGGGGRGGGRGVEAKERKVMGFFDGGGEVINKITDRCARSAGAGGAGAG